MGTFGGDYNGTFHKKINYWKEHAGKYYLLHGLKVNDVTYILQPSFNMSKPSHISAEIEVLSVESLTWESPYLEKTVFILRWSPGLLGGPQSPWLFTLNNLTNMGASGYAGIPSKQWALRSNIFNPWTIGNTWMHTQHCSYWCPGAKALGH